MDVIDCADDCGPCGHTRRYTFGITQHRNWIKPVVVLFLNDVAVVIEREVLRRHLKIVTLSVRERCVFLVSTGLKGIRPPGEELFPPEKIRLVQWRSSFVNGRTLRNVSPDLSDEQPGVLGVEQKATSEAQDPSGLMTVPKLSAMS